MQMLFKSGLMSFLALAFAVSTVSAGELSYSSNPKPTPRARGTMVSNFKKPAAEDKGLVSGIAMVASKNGMKIAIDSTNADAKIFDIVRFDFSGKGDFTNAPTAKITGHKRGRGFWGQILPTKIDSTKNGEKVTFAVTGRFTSTGRRHSLSLQMASALEGKVKFGDAECTVLITDANGNMKFNDAPRMPLKTPWALVACDKVFVITTDKKTTSAFIGHPISVNGKWYTFKLEGRKFDVTPFAGKLGKVKLAGEQWQAELLGKQFLVNISGSSEAVTVPADTYKVFTYFGRPSENATAKGPAVSGYGSKRTFAIEEGKTSEIDAGGKVVVTVSARQAKRGKNRMVTFNLYVGDSIGSRVTGINAQGKRAGAPKLEIYDESGNKVYTATFKYG